MKPFEALVIHRIALRQNVSSHHLARPRVFGSVLTKSLFTISRLEHEAQELLGVRVSVLTPGFLSAKFRNRVLQRAEPL